MKLERKDTNKMSKSKEESINIINKEFHGLKDKKDTKSLFLALETSIKDINSSEFSLVWFIDNSKKKINTFFNNRSMTLLLEKSILEQVFVSKKAFFDNYVVSHQKYNQKIDNILNIKIKSMMVVPIIDKIKGEVVACIASFNSVNNHKGDFRRYDIRSLGLLEPYVFDLLKLLNSSNMETKIENKDKIKREIQPLKKKSLPRVTRKTKLELEEEIKRQKEKIILLEKELILNKELLERKERENQEYITSIVEEEEVILNSDIYAVLEFLTNEVSYLANEEHKIHLFLEIIKNSLHNKEQLHFLNMELEKTEFIENIATKLYKREKMPIVLNSFNIHQLINDVVLLYSRIFSDKDITLNIFLTPVVPDFLDSDKYKIKSIIVHLLNSMCNFTNKGGAIEINLDFSNVAEVLTIDIKAIKPHKIKEIKKFFKQEEINNSLTSSHKGLGLSVSSNLINILGGKLKLSTLGENEHIFTVLLPMKKSKNAKNRIFFDTPTIKVAILMSEDNRDYFSLQNLVRYLISMGIDEKFIVTFNSYKKMSNMNFSHLFCFENMFSSEFKFQNFSSVTVLKYSQNSLKIKRNQKHTIYELYINSYYGLELQKILFPDMPTVELNKNTLLVEDSFLSKFSNVVKKLKIM